MVGRELTSRRGFVKSGAAALVGSSLGKLPEAPAIRKSKSRPNILWIMSDEHNAHVCGSYGNSIARTPNIDSLAASGVAFDTHYCNSPLCVPSRLSLTAGKYVSRVDVWGLTSWLPSPDIPSLPRVLNAAGYDSYLCGKQHYDYTRRYGFKQVGGNFNNNYKTGRGFRLSPSRLTEKELSPRFSQFYPGERSIILDHDRAVTVGAIEFLYKQRPKDQPFFLFAGYLAPHFPIIAPQSLWERYKGKIAMPVIPPGFLESLSLNYKVQRAGFEELEVPEDTVRRGRELYYALTEWVDNQIGLVLSALCSMLAVAENTVIIYSSDHGENMGEHGMWWKNCMFDPATRVPLIVSWPQRWSAAQRRSGASSHLDLVQTVVDLAGGNAPDDWNGHSMLPWLDNSQVRWKDFAVSEYYGLNTASGYVMAREGDWKYTYHTIIDADHPAQRELYNIASDTQEFKNLANLPEHKSRVERMHQRMVQEVAGDPDETEQRARYQLAKGYSRTDSRPPAAAGWSG